MNKYIKIDGTIEIPGDMTLDELVDFLTDAIEKKDCCWCVFWEDVTDKCREANGEVNNGDREIT